MLLSMEKLKAIEEKINSIFENIRLVYDSSELCFDLPAEIISKLSFANNIISDINVFEIKEELWECSASKDYYKYSKIVEAANSTFDKLITWKPDKYELESFSKDIKIDLTSFYNKMKLLNSNLSAEEIETISTLYTGIGLRALKLNLDLDKIMEELSNRSDEFDNQMDNIKNTAYEFNFKLKPEKIEEFIRVIYKMYYNNFFTNAKEPDTLNEVDILMAFEKFFGINILDADWFSPGIGIEYIGSVWDKSLLSNTKITTPIIPPVSTKAFYEYLTINKNELLASKIKEEFSTEKGKAIRILIYVLETNNPALLTILYRQGKEFYNSMTNYFKRDIGTYQSIFNYKVDSKYDDKEIQNMKFRLNKVLESL